MSQKISMQKELIAEEEPFTLVTSRRKKKFCRVSVSVTPNPSDHLESIEIDEASVIQRIKVKIDELKQSKYFENSIKKLKNILSELDKVSFDEIICFGIGHFGDCLISRYQLAFILAVKSKLNIEQIIFHEPILRRSEVNILHAFNCCTFAKNLEGKLSIKPVGLTLIYSPHCPKQLTNNLLWKNWTAERLIRFIYIGNSFSNLINSTPSRFLDTDAYFIVKIQPYTKEQALENHFKFTDIFNDTAIHTFPKEKLEKLDQEFWCENLDEPIYLESIELITADFIDKLTL